LSVSGQEMAFVQTLRLAIVSLALKLLLKDAQSATPWVVVTLFRLIGRKSIQDSSPRFCTK